MTTHVRDNPAENRYEVYADDRLAGFSDYRLSAHKIAFTHTEIGEEFSGRGLARKLVAVELADSRRRGLAVLPFCPYVRKVLADSHRAPSRRSIDRLPEMMATRRGRGGRLVIVRGMPDVPRWVYADKQLPSIHGAMAAVAQEIRTRADELGIDRAVLELVNLRCSQINGCAFCLHLHTHLALRAGESPQRIAVLPAWRDSGLFSSLERAALTIADAVTTVADQHLSDDAYDLLREDLTDDQLALLVYSASMINAFNRVSILSHHPVTHRESFGAPPKRSTHAP